MSLRVLLGGVLLLALASGAQAQVGPQLLPSAALQCLAHREGPTAEPVYPIAEYNAGTDGRVQVELVFSSPQSPPDVKVLLLQGGERFEKAVRDHAAGLRVPCLAAAGGSARLVQDFIFDGQNRRMNASDPQDAERQARQRLLDCVVHASGERVPPYPAAARRANIQGRVLAQVEFTDASSAPKADVRARPYADVLVRATRAWLKDLRMPCHQGAPISADWTFVYLFEGERFGFIQVGFREFVGSIRGLETQTVALDTTKMGCPFDVRLQYRQPDWPNAVWQVGERNAARRPLLAWLAASELKANESSQDAFYGDTVRLTIPCIRIDLKPKEKS